MSFLAALGVMLCIAFLVFNIKNRNVRLIKMSSPNINNLILVGCILVYTSVIVQDVKGLWLDCLCHVRLYLTVLGFSLGYGAMFAKTWRVYEIMTASRRFTKVTKDLRDSRLLMTVLVLVAINLLVLVIWTAFDPMAMTPKDIEDSEIDREDDVLEIKQTLVCQSRYQLQFTLGLIALQALLILFGAFLAFQTRKMTIPELNDSRWVGLCIYNVVVLGSLGTILVLGTSQTPHVNYLLMSIITTLGTTLTQCLVFVPKPASGVGYPFTLFRSPSLYLWHFPSN
ncbi:gamma-aminobutyric acid type B receptor subunit 2-like [Littorina saxatilis]|uniref:gamma-aminobutyric acid type B receptor subunit 2-like n=1 Tax=Littorina saxatilis TaxID=31220 RepID=UPI0038B4669A